MSATPTIACLMPTFNRPSETPEMLGESLAAFLEQDYQAAAHLIIGNDCPEQTLSVAREFQSIVHVVNYPRRFETLGQKLHAMASLATMQYGAEALCRWDDDDYSLPHRLSYSADQLGVGVEWRPSNYWWHRAGLPGEVWEVERAGNTHIQAIWRPEVLEQIGGYPDRTGDEDQAFNQALHRRYKTPIAGHGNIDPAELFYVYRWGNSPRHLSGRGGGKALREQYKRIGELHIVPGEFEIIPKRWELPARRVTLAERPARELELRQA